MARRNLAENVQHGRVTRLVLSYATSPDVSGTLRSRVPPSTICESLDFYQRFAVLVREIYVSDSILVPASRAEGYWFESSWACWKKMEKRWSWKRIDFKPSVWQNLQIGCFHTTGGFLMPRLRNRQPKLCFYPNEGYIVFCAGKRIHRKSINYNELRKSPARSFRWKMIEKRCFFIDESRFFDVAVCCVWIGINTAIFFPEKSEKSGKSLGVWCIPSGDRTFILKELVEE